MGYFYSPNENLEKRVNLFFSELDRINREMFDGVLSVILVGSLSRGEGTWRYNNDAPELLSDIEFFTVYPSQFFQFDYFQNAIKELRNSIFSDQNSPLFHIDNTFTPINRIKNCGRKLIIFDTVFWGKCVVGADVLPLYPQISIANIVLDDIWDVMSHRVFSVIYYGFVLKENGDAEGYRYSLAKNSLDLMTVLLAMKGELKSGFINRLEAIEQIDSIPFLYKKYFKYCLDVKLHSYIGNEQYEICDMEKYFIEIINYCLNGFRIPVKNKIINSRYLIHTSLGVLRRVFVDKHIPCTRKKHLKIMIEKMCQNKRLSQRDLMDNLVIYAYPKE